MSAAEPSDSSVSGTQPSPAAAAIVRAGSWALGLAADAAQATAQALAGKAIEGPAGEAALARLVRHGSAAVGSAIALAVTSGRAAASAGAPAPARGGVPPMPERAEEAAPPRGLRLAPGGTARIPLSIDNPGATPMEGLAPRLAGARFEGAPAAPAFALGFAPETLTVAPRDFEKLVVTLTLDADIAAGGWTALFALDADDTALHELPFQVVATAGAAEPAAG